MLIMVHRDFTCFLRVFSVLPRTHFEIWRPFILDHLDATSLAGGGAGRCNKCTVEKLGCEYESVYVQFWKIAQMISNHLKSTYLYTYYLLYESTFSSKSVKITDAHILCFFVLCFSLFFYPHIPMSHVISHVRSSFEPKIIPMPCFATWGYHRKLCLVVSNLVVFNRNPLNNGMMIMMIPNDEI